MEAIEVKQISCIFQHSALCLPVESWSCVHFVSNHPGGDDHPDVIKATHNTLAREYSL